MSEEKKDWELEYSDENDGEQEDTETGKNPDASIEDAVYDWARCLVSAVVGVVLLFTFCVRMVGVAGGSMQNTLYTGDRIIMLNSMFCEYERGDIVVVNAYNSILSETIIKRVIAVGGQTVDIDFASGAVYVDGERLDEPYVKEPTFTTGGTEFPLTLAEDEIFVMGDNRNHSTDSRSSMLGPVKVDYVQGKAVFLLLPGKTEQTDKMDFSRIGFVS